MMAHREFIWCHFHTIWGVAYSDIMKKSIYTEPHLKLCAWLRARREEKRLKTRELAALLDVHHSKITCVEKGRRRLDVVEFVTWCVALGANPRDIIGQIWLLEMGEKTATLAQSAEAGRAAESKPVSYVSRKK